MGNNLQAQKKSLATASLLRLHLQLVVYTFQAHQVIMISLLNHTSISIHQDHVAAYEGGLQKARLLWIEKSASLR